MANPSLSTVVRHCCEPQKVRRSEIQAPHGSFFPPRRQSSVVGTCVKKLPQWLSEASRNISASYLSFGCDKATALATDALNAPRSHLLTLSCFLRDRPIPPSSSTRRVSTTSTCRGRDVRNPFTACSYCISSPAVCGRHIFANPLKRSRSLDTYPPEYTFPHREISVSKTNTCEQRRNNIVLQTTKNLIESVQQIVFMNPPPHHVINSDLAVQASQHLGHRTLEVGRRAQNALGHTRGGKQTFGGGDGEHFLGFSHQRHLPINILATCQASKIMSPPANRLSPPLGLA